MIALKFHDPYHLRRTLVFRVPNTGFSQIELLKSQPEITITPRIALALLDRCRGMDTVVIVTENGSHHVVVPCPTFVTSCSRMMHAETATTPDLSRLLNALHRLSKGGMTMQPMKFQATPGGVPPTLAAKSDQTPQWLLPHPRVLLDNVWWPTDVAGSLENFFQRPVLGALQEASAWRPSITSVPSVFENLKAVLSVATNAPFLPFLCAALANDVVRQQCVPANVRLPRAPFWTLLLHLYLSRCVDVFWPTDALAVHGIGALVTVHPLKSPRLLALELLDEVKAPVDREPLVRFESSLDGPVVPPSAHASDEPQLMCVSRVHQISIEIADEWIPLLSGAFVQSAETHCRGALSQTLYLPDSDQWFMCPEHRLDDFFFAYADTRVQVMIDEHRVYRRGPGQPWWASPSAAGVRPNVLMDVKVTRDLPHPLRSEHPEPMRARCADGTMARFLCDSAGPSICLDPPLDPDAMQDVLSFAALHTRPTTPVNTCLYTCHPPQYAHVPSTMPPVQSCRVSGCSRCRRFVTPLALNGDSALISRQELPLVLWWHWHRFAEDALVSSSRAQDLVRRWLVPQCHRLQTLLATSMQNHRDSQPVVTPVHHKASSHNATPTASALRRPSSSSSNHHKFSDGTTWDLNRIVCAEAKRMNLSSLDANVVYLLWSISARSIASDYNSWLRVGMLLYEIDAEQFLSLWRWWSWRYGDPESYSGLRDWQAKWSALRSSKSKGPREAMLSLTNMAKKCNGGTLSFEPSRVRAALQDMRKGATQMNVV